MGLPAGTVTLLFSDIEGSTRLLEQLGEDYSEVLDEHHRIVRDAMLGHGGYEVRTEGDAFFVAFARATDAVRAAVAAQRGLAACAWPGGVALRVRMGVHTGEPQITGGDYVGMDVHCAARICSAAHGGQLIVSETTERVLSGGGVEGIGARGLGVHRLKDLPRPVRLYQVVADGLVADFPPLRAVERPVTDLHGQWAAPTELFGREADLDRLVRLVRERLTRLVTLVGPGGVGKTRLALEAAGRLAGDFADGARFVELAAVSEPRELPGAIARALAAQMSESESSKAAVLRFLRDRHLLLVLDNFEQLMAGSLLVGEALSSSRDLTIIVTSREPTRLAAERLYPVRPLELPKASAQASPARLERYSAVALFCDRARALDPGFALDEVTAQPVGEICRRLDGLPLALELAAARMALLSPAELAARLDHALAMLVGGARDAPERQRTLRATIDWSYDLLSAPERRAFELMAVFAGGATVAAAEAVTGASLDTLDSLVAKQLLARRDNRLFMLETIREHALERLADRPDAEAVQRRRAAWCLTFLREAMPHLMQADRTEWVARLDAEVPNVLGALSWALETRQSELALQLVVEHGAYWWYTNRGQDVLPWTRAALKLAGDVSPRLRASALLYQARIAGTREPLHYRNDLQTSLQLYRACDDAPGIAACLGHLAYAEAWAGNHQQAEALGDEAVLFARRANDEHALAQALAQRAQASATYDEAASHARTAVAHLQAVGDLSRLARLCTNIGYLAIVDRHYHDAIAWLNDALEAACGLGITSSNMFVRGCHGLAHLFLDELDEAAQGLADALAIYRETRIEELAGELLISVSAVTSRYGELACGAKLAGAARAHETPGRSWNEKTVRARLNDEILSPARARYGAESWDRAAREGASLTVDDAIDLALTIGRFAPPMPALEGRLATPLDETPKLATTRVTGGGGARRRTPRRRS